MRSVLTLEEFAYRCIWLEHIRLRGFISEHEADKHFRKTLCRVRNGLGRLERAEPSEWDAMVKGWYAEYLKFEQHIAHVQRFLMEMWATMGDPVDDFNGNVTELTEKLLDLAREQREKLREGIVVPS
jgi:hypothetical protein